LDNTPPIRLLTFSTLYPNAVQPRHGIFVETRLRQLISSGGVTARVMAPVPWFPSANPAFGRYANYARMPRAEQHHGIEVLHPRYPMIPKIGMNLSPFALALSCLSPMKQLIQSGNDFDLIDAHYFYPDGVAAVLLGKLLNKPVVITARGSDINVIPKYRLPRKMIVWAANHAAHLITVSAALKTSLSGLGVPPEKITVLRNGVDTELFYPTAREEMRQLLGISGPLLLSVGNLIPLKGHDLAIKALQQLEGMQLILIGDGPEKAALQQLSRSLGVADRTGFLDNLTQTDLARYYSAADVLILASSREGWANVLLESMACGTPVIATPVGGNPEIIVSPAAGRILTERTADAIARSVRKLTDSDADRHQTRQFASSFGWGEINLGQKTIFKQVLSTHHS
jgi:glycosyltransferase involved in cell wall biosynthesis